MTWDWEVGHLQLIERILRSYLIYFVICPQGKLLILLCSHIPIFKLSIIIIHSKWLLGSTWSGKWAGDLCIWIPMDCWVCVAVVLRERLIKNNTLKWGWKSVVLSLRKIMRYFFLGYLGAAGAWKCRYNIQWFSVTQNKMILLSKSFLTSAWKCGSLDEGNIYLQNHTHCQCIQFSRNASCP